MSGDEDLARALVAMQDSLALTQKYLAKAAAGTEAGKEAGKLIAVEKPKPSYDKKIEVFVSYKVSWLADISAISSTFKAQFKMFYRWTDHNLIGMPKDSKVDFKKLPGVLNPDIELLQSMDCELLSRSERRAASYLSFRQLLTLFISFFLFRSSTRIVNSLTGEVKITNEYKGSIFITNMSLQMFPYDCQNLCISVRPHKLAVDKIQLIPAAASECAMERTVTHEWKVVGHCLRSVLTDPSSSSTGKSYSQINVLVLTARKSGWFETHIFLTSTMFLLINFVTFCFGEDDRGGRMDISMATLIASIANKYVVCDELPKVNYRTVVDIFIEISFFLQFLTILATTIIYSFRETPEFFYGVVSLNSFFFVLELSICVVFGDWFYKRLHNHMIDIQVWMQKCRQTNDENEKRFNFSYVSAIDEKVGLHHRSLLSKVVTVADNFGKGDIEFFMDFDTHSTINFLGKINDIDNKRRNRLLSILFKEARSEEEKNVVNAIKTLSGRRRSIVSAGSNKGCVDSKQAQMRIASWWRERIYKRNIIRLRGEQKFMKRDLAARQVQRWFRLKRYVYVHSGMSDSVRMRDFFAGIKSHDEKGRAYTFRRPNASPTSSRTAFNEFTK